MPVIVSPIQVMLLSYADGKLQAAAIDSKGRAMTTNSLVPCPTCNSRREFLIAEPVHPHRDGHEIRTFLCRTCDIRSRYLITRHSITPLTAAV
jgi:C4-type Zn-finger protein